MKLTMEFVETSTGYSSADGRFDLLVGEQGCRIFDWRHPSWDGVEWMTIEQGMTVCMRRVHEERSNHRARSTS